MAEPMKDPKGVADMLRRFADDIEAGCVSWIWIASKYTGGLSIKYSAGEGAPKRPGSM